MEAAEMMGDTYFHGDPLAGVEPNPQLAAQHYHAAAAQGSSLAHANLGMMYSHGIGVDPDPVQAVHHLNQAANLGNDFAHNGLGIIYLGNAGLPANHTKAKE